MLPELTKNGEAMIRLGHLILSWITFERMTTRSGQASKTYSAHNIKVSAMSDKAVMANFRVQ